MLRYLLPVIEAVEGFFNLLLIVRFLLSGTQYEQRTVLAPTIAALSNWLVIPLSRIVPRVRGKESATLVAALLVTTLLVMVVLGLRGFDLLQQPSVMISAILISSALAIAERFVQLSMIVIIVSVVTTWLRISGPVVMLIDQFTYWLLRPLRRYIPPIGGIDLTPLVALLIAQLMTLLISDMSRSVSSIF